MTGAFSKIQADSQLSNAIIVEVAMTCMVITVFLLVAINNQTKTPDGPIIVGLTVAATLLAGWDKIVIIRVLILVDITIKHSLQ